MGNTLKTAGLLFGLTCLLLFIGGLLGGRAGMTVALILAAVMNLGSWWFSDKLVLRMYRAQPVSQSEAPRLYAMVQRLTQRAGMPMPSLYVLPQNAANAFATGRDPQHAAVAVTRGLVDILDEREVEGVLAHELAHVQNRDTLTMAVAATLAGAVMWLATMARFSAMFGGYGRDDRGGHGGVVGLLAVAILAPLAAMIIQMWVSRTREYAADAAGARMAGSPDGLASALGKLSQASGRRPLAASPQTAHLFIVNPLSGGGMARWFSTHPPLEERIARLRAMRLQPA